MSKFRKGSDDTYYVNPLATHRDLLQRVTGLISTDDKEELGRLSEYADQQAKMFPSSYYLKLVRAKLCGFLHHDTDQAISLLSSVVGEGVPPPVKSIALFELGVKLIDVGQQDKAADALRGALELTPRTETLITTWE